MGDAGGSSIFAKLNNIIGAIADHVAIWTAAKAGNLDTTVSSRAPASTALSTAQWTNTRAGYLDKLNSGVTVGALTGKQIKSVQRGIAGPPNSGSFGATGNIAVATVDMTKSIVLCSGGETAYARLTSATNIEYCTNSTNRSMAWQLIEFY